METLDDSNLSFVVSDRIPITQSRKDISKIMAVTLLNLTETCVLCPTDSL